MSFMPSSLEKDTIKGGYGLLYIKDDDLAKSHYKTSGETCRPASDVSLE
jgi:hypothetical protein